MMNSLLIQTDKGISHAWIEWRDERRPTLDLLGRGEVVMASPHVARDVRFSGPDATWQRFIMRSDGFVAAIDPTLPMA